MLKQNSSELFDIISNANCVIDYDNKLLMLSFKDSKYIEKFNIDSNLIKILQEFLYEYIGQLFKIDVRSSDSVKRINVDERKLDLKNRKIVKYFLERYNAIIEEIEIF